ncbi:hypothetical protein D187_005634 [Cystobacter fuscus DSM 2262]|uniref:Zinc finger/thioredoxin putative domain-containing protein n=1 Tax=Cystobacter fuscus (strain ATCC 25194 / DSM 2262 / NBRC 100088 / M29) TaxID=1242864 RepID=S9QPJ5_CYSF2|nr:tetratricopeptide repeat protein [Cystobacter fuscus]EPX63229.1 hypothetical protein D187_005634 [Cystobacter fuscus DSM 2262]
MRITCQKCAAAYAIDDRVITPKGVRAQCPRCRHLQLVKREESASSAEPAPEPAPAAKPAAAKPAAAAAKPAAAAAKPAAAAVAKPAAAAVAKPAAAAAAKPAAAAAKPAAAAAKPAAAAAKPAAAAAKPAAAAAKPSAARPAASARPATLSDELFGDLSQLSPPTGEIPTDSLLDDVSPSDGPPPSPFPPASKDSLFGDIGELTQSSPSNPTLEAEDEGRQHTPSYSLPSGDLLFDEPEPPPPASAPPPTRPAPKPAVQARQEAAPAAPAFPAPSDDALFDFNAPPGFDAPPPAPPPPARPAAQARAAPQPAPEPSDDALFDFNAPPGFDAPPPAEAPAPAAGGDPLLDFFGAAPDAAPPAAPARPAPFAAPAPAPTPVAKGCRECGKPLVDPFDQALGACEDCRHRGQNPEPQSAQEAAPSVEVIDLPPMDSSMPEAGRSIPAAPPLPPEPRSAARAAAARTGVAVSASSGRSKGPLVAAVVVLLLAGAGAAAYFLSPDVKTLVEKPLAAAGSGSGSAPKKQDPSEPLPPAVAAVLPRWQLLFVDSDSKEGDSQRLLEEGQALLAKDQRFAYAQAAELFQRALLADPRSDAAIGGYVQALALGRGSLMDDTSFQEARSLIEAAEQRDPGNADLRVAHANLLLAHPEDSGNLEQARKIAEDVLADTKEGTGVQKAEAHLVMGRTFMASSRELAIEHFESALAISSELERVHYYRALLDESSGDYSAAIGRLQKRLEQDPEHWETISTLVRIYLEVGEPQLARQLYETRLKAAPNDFQTLLASAVMRYQAEGSLQAALKALRGMLDNRDKYDQRQVAELLLHLSITERLANNLDASAKAGREALQLEKNNPAVHLQLFFVSLARKDAAEATSHLAILKGHLGEPALEKILEGRLRLLERKPAEAMTLFTEAAKLDPRHTDALLLAGVAAAQDGRREEAFRVLAQALLGDPHRVAPRPVLTPFYQRPGELIQGLDGSIAGIARGDDDLLPFLYEGLLRYHQGEGAAAEKMFKKVSDVDASNAQASSFRALLAMARRDRKSADDAKGHAARAVAGGRQVALAHYVQGLVLINSKQVEPARKSLREAVALAPKLYAAEVKLGELEAPSSPGPVRERLVRLLGIDPSYLPAKRVLYLIDKRG